MPRDTTAWSARTSREGTSSEGNGGTLHHLVFDGHFVGKGVWSALNTKSLLGLVFGLAKSGFYHFTLKSSAYKQFLIYPNTTKSA